MRNLKKFLALVLAMMMVMSLMLTVNAAKTPAEFSDSSKVNSTYAEAVNVLSALGVVKGDDRGFRPQETITRAEVAAMLYRIAHNDADESQVAIYKDYGKFPDVPSDKWYAGAVNYCANSEYIKGYSDGTFGAWRDITGYEVLAMTLRVLGYGQNGEFEGSGWMVQTARYARVAGLTDRIKEGTLGAPATREMVAEIMFQALQATLVDYNMLLNYYPAIVLIADNEDNRAAYKLAIDDGLKLPVNSNLMYENYGIVGKTAGADDPYGRPTTAWVKDRTDDTITGTDKTTAGTPDGNAGKYIVNKSLDDSVVITANNSAKGQWGASATATEADVDNIGLGPNVEEISIAATPLVTYTDGVTECQVSKDINNDKTIAWDDITEYLNGSKLYDLDAANHKYVVDNGQYDKSFANQSAAAARPANFDARHTTTDFIGATGRTTEIYNLGDIDDDNNDEYRFVYIDTLLGVVSSTTTELKDANGHVIRAAMAKVAIGNTGKTLDLPNPSGKFKADDLVLVQTPNGDLTEGGNLTVGTTAGVGLYKVDNPDTAPLDPRDLPDTGDEFVWDSTNSTGKNAKLLATPAQKLRVKVTATYGAANLKMAIGADDGKTYRASNAFLAGRNVVLDNSATTFDNDKRNVNSGNAGTYTVSANKTVPTTWYDIDQPKFGITNSMIGDTYDIVLDQNGYIVGMDKVRESTTSNVGIITAIDTDRIGMGKHMPVVTAFMADGKTAEFKLFGIVPDGAGGDYDTAIDNFHTNGKLSASEKQLLSAYALSTAADLAWGTDNLYEGLGVGSLVKFEAITIDGVSGHFISDFDAEAARNTGSKKQSTLFGDHDGSSGPMGSADGDDMVLTGSAWSLGTAVDTYTNNEPNVKAGANEVNTLLNSKSTVFVAEGDYRYNVGGANEGGNVDIEYTVYEGFKKMPTIVGNSGDDNILFQQLNNDPSYVFIYAADTSKQFNIRDKSPITVDKSYLVLSRGATLEEYSEYNVLENGKETTLKVANINNNNNAGLNEQVEAAMAAKQLISVQNTNRKGYVTAIATLDSLLATDNVTQANTAWTVADDKTVLAASTLLPGWKVDGTNNWDFKSDASKSYWKVTESNDVMSIRNVEYNSSNGQHTPTKDAAGEIMYMTMAEGCTFQLVNLDLKTVRTIEKAEALDYINGVSPASSVIHTGPNADKWENQDLAPHDFTYEFDADGYVCNIYVIENTPTAT